MAHNHGSEYQIRIISDDGTEETTRWMSSQEQLAEAIASLQRTPGKSFWLRERNILCPTCCEQHQVMSDCPIAEIPCQRYRPHDSHYLLAVGARNRHEVFRVSLEHGR